MTQFGQGSGDIRLNRSFHEDEFRLHFDQSTDDRSNSSEGEAEQASAASAESSDADVDTIHAYVSEVQKIKRSLSRQNSLRFFQPTDSQNASSTSSSLASSPQPFSVPTLSLTTASSADSSSPAPRLGSSLQSSNDDSEEPTADPQKPNHVRDPLKARKLMDEIRDVQSKLEFGSCSMSAEELLDEFQRYSFTMEGGGESSGGSSETLQVCRSFYDIICLRHLYLDEEDHVFPRRVTSLPPGMEPRPIPYYDPFNSVVLPKSDHIFQMVDGVMNVYSNKKDFTAGRVCYDFIDYHIFYGHYKAVSKLCSSAAAKSFAYRRLRLLEEKFNLHLLLNESKEVAEQKRVPHRDFYNVRKVDTHVHLSSCMNQKSLLRFIKRKLANESQQIVLKKGQDLMTLEQVFKMLNLTAHELSVDTLDVHADRSTFHRFDKFNLKYNPCGQSELREIFLKTDNYIKGRYFGELIRQVCDELEESKYQMAEYRVSIYGRSPAEWEALAEWIYNSPGFSSNVRWLIQIPRLYNVHRSGGIVHSFQDMLRNVFNPLFEVTCDPATYPNLNRFLQQVVGFDSVDDESKGERRFHSRLPSPAQWVSDDNPPFAYYMYYMYANLKILNQFRRERGLNTFAFRPHCGEAGDDSHLCSTFLLARNISHGILLRKNMVMQYLYYLCQIGLALSPLSNNGLFLKYSRNPFPTFFARGLNVSLSTDDPLMFHFTREPLIEEYSIAAQVFDLSNADLCEIALNSVRQSGFEPEVKQYWLGPKFEIMGKEGNDMDHTNVPDVRAHYRKKTLLEENLFILICGQRNLTSIEEGFDLLRRRRLEPNFDAYEYLLREFTHFDSPINTTTVVREVRRRRLARRRDVRDYVSVPRTIHSTLDEDLFSMVSAGTSSSSLNTGPAMRSGAFPTGIQDPKPLSAASHIIARHSNRHPRNVHDLASSSLSRSSLMDHADDERSSSNEDSNSSSTATTMLILAALVIGPIIIASLISRLKPRQ